jgi:hypothetical protein
VNVTNLSIPVHHTHQKLNGAGDVDIGVTEKILFVMFIAQITKSMGRGGEDEADSAIL